MGFAWITESQRRDMERDRREGDRLIASADWVKIARDAELRRMGLLQPQKDTP